LEERCNQGEDKVKETFVLALATMLGVGYLVFKAGGSGFVAISGGSSGSVTPSGGSVGGGSAQRATLTFAPSSSVKANPIVESSLPEWFIKSVETPLPKKFEPAIYMHQIEALRARGY